MNAIRLLIDPPSEGAWNMAVDETLLETAATTGQATLRFYQWKKPTLSLGYFQLAADRGQHAASTACPLIRRPSGGGAILHDRELTYCIALPRTSNWTVAPKQLYDLCHITLVEALQKWRIAASLYTPNRDDAACGKPPPQAQPFLCFQRRTCGDVVFGEIKIAGSAQRRRRQAVLQHGSILLARSAYAPELLGVQELSGVRIEPDDLRVRWLPQLLKRLGAVGDPGNLTDREAVRSSEYADRFASAAYIDRRSSGVG